LPFGLISFQCDWFSPRKKFVGSIGANLLEPAGVHLLVAAFLVAGEVVGEGEADAAVGAHL